MKKINLIIVALLLLGVLGVTYIEASVKPGIRRQEQRYLLEQKDPLTHDFGNALKFQSEYMGDSSNFVNLNAVLPLQDIKRTFELHPDTLTAEIYYQETVADIDQALFKRSLVYNSTANFVLIKNLEVLLMHFADASFTITRDAIEQWYGVKPAVLQDEAIWKNEVQSKLSEHAYVESFIADNIR